MSLGHRTNCVQYQEPPLPSTHLKGDYRRAYLELPLLLRQPLPLDLAEVNAGEQATDPDHMLQVVVKGVGGIVLGAPHLSLRCCKSLQQGQDLHRGTIAVGRCGHYLARSCQEGWKRALRFPSHQLTSKRPCTIRPSA